MSWRRKKVGLALDVDHVPTGVTGPEGFRDELGLCLTPRQFRPLLAARGMELTIALWRYYHKQDPFSPVFHQDFAYALIDELLEQKRIHDAVEIARLADLSGQNIAQMYANEGDLQRRTTR